ncbi:MAG: bifunctional DNA-formamidopyrimidine glycosylase/DNA-(apurinic or apyrimidinic site) lyase [Chloroflexi bacterium]|nr:bifunctional DNA-formamidopyrimidine glycosylase/DNA-(apurinic or apyrimidinic site) lyase [Chloroflexota bacterium]
MPELPDVEALRRYLLAQGLVGRGIFAAHTEWSGAVRWPSPEQFTAQLVGRRIGALERRAKFMLFRLDRGTLAAHLGMTGWLHLVPQGVPPLRHTRHWFDLDDGRVLAFTDPRKLGRLWLVEDPSSLVAGLGPEPLSDEFTVGYLASRLAGRRVPVKPLLLEQDVVAGMGNIYADDTLFVAGLHPLRPAGELSAKEVVRLHAAVCQVLQEAVERLAPVLPVEGPASESIRGMATLQVPRQAGAPCSRCDGPIAHLMVRGRSAYFCPRCQPEF